MCRRIDALDELIANAGQLSAACMERLPTGAALRAAYRAVVAEGTPPAMTDLLDRLAAGDTEGEA